ncbi:MAG TPA: hypothetical protein VEB66_12255 [Opitutaceae bacterium]|nr:hypothetical protein [Opitutaceae bacterium]
MRVPASCLAALALLAAASAQIDRPAEPPARDKSPFVFSILPRGIQKNPHVDFNIITEMTDEGRQAAKPTAAAPVYYITKPAGFLQLGHGAPAGEKPPEVERMERVLERALSASGYRGADKDHPPSLVIIYSWGSHSNPLVDDDPENNTVPNKVLVDELIERARLVGGEKFARELVQAMATQGAAQRAMPKPRVDPNGAVDTHFNVQGDAAGAMTQIFSPVEAFRQRSAKHRGLMEDVGSSVYFVIASAYDFQSVAEEKRLLLWRTKMTVNSRGVAMTETLPALIASAGPYFGQDMGEVQVVTQRISREGTVEIGTPEVVGFGDDVVPGSRPAGESRQP